MSGGGEEENRGNLCPSIFRPRATWRIRTTFATFICVPFSRTAAQLSRSVFSFLLSLFRSHTQLPLEVRFLRKQMEIVARLSPREDYVAVEVEVKVEVQVSKERSRPRSRSRNSQPKILDLSLGLGLPLQKFVRYYNTQRTHLGIGIELTQCHKGASQRQHQR
jgi:hypothetical protein